MMIKTDLHMARLKPEMVDEYRRMHDNIWPEMVAAYNAAGITQIRCFLNGVDLIIYFEYDDTIFSDAKESLRNNDVEIRWQKIMKTFADPAFKAVHFDEVFTMNNPSRD